MHKKTRNKNILFILPKYYPHIGGVEKHVYEISNRLINKNYNINILTERYDDVLPRKEIINKIKIIRIQYPKIKYLGLLFIWFELLKNIKIILNADIVHIHDVFIWYLPFKFIFTRKKVFTTFHGWEGNYPIPLINIVQKKIASTLSEKTMAVGDYIGKYYGINPNVVVYGATRPIFRVNKLKKIKRGIVFVGRLQKDTGLLDFIKWLKKYNKRNVIFCGDGELKNLCKKYGQIVGFSSVDKYLLNAKKCVVSGYLSCLEAFSYKCSVKIFCNNRLKKDYWKMSPFIKYINNNDIEGGYNWSMKQTWSKLTNEYINFWKI